VSGKKILRWAFITLAVVAVASTVGWISNAASRAACQQQVGSWIFSHPVGGRHFHLLDPDEDKSVRASFSSVGASYSVLASDSDDPKTWPRVSMQAHSLIPFVISVDYFWEREAEIGGGATKWFLCLFGKTVEIGETNEYAT
jgi:hypothetical protein